jgi:hypothetical protein
MLVIILTSCRPNNKGSLKYVKKLGDYPSASAIEYTSGQFFVMGDDARNILILDSNLTVQDSVELYSYPEKRIPKDIKHDLEAIALYEDSTGAEIFLFGSGSLSQYRNGAWRCSVKTKAKDSMSLEPLYAEIKNAGVKEINVEGACFIPGFLILANRGNKSYAKNYLVLLNEKFWKRRENYNITISEVGQNMDTASFIGISGLAYAVQSDQLILTASTEDTRSTHGDGAIGKSYLWIVKNISEKIKNKTINPDQIIDLESVDWRFKNQKIESACVTGETKDFLYLVLAADNDDGSSTLFKMKVKN